MLTHSTLLISKMDPIKYIFEKPALTGRLARWKMLLYEYDIQYVIQKAIKGSILADHLAHQPLEEYQSMKFDFPDEDVMKLDDYDGVDLQERWTLTFDGASNATCHGIREILTSPCNTHTLIMARLCFDCRNNMA